jgi:hypothetical protein
MIHPAHAKHVISVITVHFDTLLCRNTTLLRHTPYSHMYFNTIPKILALACLGSLPAQANPPYNPDEPPPPPTVPQGPTPSGVPSNTACCGYELTNRGGAYFRYTHEIDFDKVRLSPVNLSETSSNHLCCNS